MMQKLLIIGVKRTTGVNNVCTTHCTEFSSREMNS